MTKMMFILKMAQKLIKLEKLMQYHLKQLSLQPLMFKILLAHLFKIYKTELRNTSFMFSLRD